MNTHDNVQLVEDAFGAIGRGDLHRLVALCAEDMEWIVPGEWVLSGTHRGHEGLAVLFQKASDLIETSFPEPPEFVGQGNRVLVIGFSTGRVKATNKTFDDHFAFAVTVHDGKLAKIREYVDTLALWRASSQP